MNEHAKQYLNDYFELELSPHYAVMLTGTWGAGKTHFINRFCESPATETKKCHYISLYGLTSTSEIDDLIYASLHKFLANKHVKFAGKIVAMALKATLKVDINNDGKNDDLNANLTIPQIDLESILNKDGNPQSVFIFDDFERCTINKVQLLGYINHFVEHVGAKVIILSNTDKIPKEENFEISKEKVIGQVLEIETDVESALTSFLDLFSDEKLRTLLAQEKVLLISIFKQSKYNNLRALRTALLHFRRIYAALPSQATSSDEYCKKLLNTVIPLSLEASAGTDIKGLLNYWSDILNEHEVKKLASISQKYNIFQWSFSKAECLMWKDFFLKGFLNEQALHEIVETDPVFLKKNKPDWMKLCQYRHIDQSTFESAYSNVFAQIKRHEFTDIHQALLIYSCLMRLSEIGLSPVPSSSELINTAKAYIQHIKDHNPEKYQLFFSSYRYNNAVRIGEGAIFNGMSIFKSNVYQELCAWLQEQHHEFIKKTQCDMAQNLLNEIKNIPQQHESLIDNFTDLDPYNKFPIFASLDAQEVFNALQNLNTTEEWRLVSHLIIEHVKFLSAYNKEDALKELNFYEQLEKLLTDNMDSFQGKVVILGVQDLQKALKTVIQRCKSLEKS